MKFTQICFNVLADVALVFFINIWSNFTPFSKFWVEWGGWKFWGSRYDVKLTLASVMVLQKWDVITIILPTSDESFAPFVVSKPVFTCSRSTMEILENTWNLFTVNNKDIRSTSLIWFRCLYYWVWKDLTHCLSVSLLLLNKY